MPRSKQITYALLISDCSSNSGFVTLSELKDYYEVLGTVFMSTYCLKFKMVQSTLGIQ